MVLEFIISILYLFSDFLYWAKLAASIIVLRLWKRFRSNRFDLYDFTVKNEPEKLGVLVPNEERILESPFPEEYLQKAADEIFIYGVNTKSQSLVVRVSRAPNEEAEAWIYLKVEDGRWYELKDTAGYQRNYGGKCTSFTCGGLQMHYLTPMRRWRITYCGMLKEVVKENEKKETNDVFVKFAFLWSASSDVFDPSYDFDIRSTAEAMAGANWKSAIPPVKKISEHLNFYYQSGVITGIVSVEDQPDVEMYLYGERIRYLGKFCAAVGCKFKHILGVTPKSGLVVHLGKASVPNIFHNLPFGFIVHPDGINRMIEDGTIISRMSGKNESGEELTATFRAKRQYELHGRFVGDGVRFTSEHSWNGHLEMVGIEFEVDGIQGSGFMIYGEIVKLPERKPQSIPPSLSCAAAPLTVAFTDEASHLPELTGGKGSSLGMLTKLSDLMKSEFVVPKGIIVTTAAYKEFLSVDVIHKIENMKDIAYGNIPGNIHEACKIVSSAIEQSYLPDKITKEIEEKLKKICVGNFNQQKFAVRSSATGEDTDQMSAAGQMDTFLGIKGLKEIFTAVKKCWASQFGYIATEYKRQNGQILNSPMAVVIQQMVDCEAAGVLFTCDPVTNNPSTVFITGNYGLGESVVSGTEEPDTVVLKRLSSSEVEIKSVTIGLKQHRTVMSDTNNENEETVVAVDVPEDKRRECCISEEMAIRLGNLSLKIEKHFKSPRDIEWGIKDNVIHILQSRPITTGVAVSDYEIKHEFDGPIRCEGDFFSIANVGEVFPNATSPLGMDVLSGSLNITFQQKEMKERQKNTFHRHIYFPSGFTVPFYNHLTMTVVDLITRVADLESTASQSMMVAFFGRILDDPELKVIAKYREAGEMKKTLKYYFITVKNLLFSGIGVEKLREKVFSYNIPVKKGKNSKEIFDIVTKSCSHNTETFLSHILNTEMSSMWNMYLLSLLGNAKGSIDSDVYSDFARLLSSMSNVESADVPSAMQELAQEIAKDTNCGAFKSMTLEEAQEWLETSPSISGYRFRKFIKKHGHRCLKEFDVHSVPWGIDPKPLIKLLKNMLDSCQNAKEKKTEEFSELLSQMKVPLNLKTKIILKFLLPQCRRGVRMRENCKSTLIKSMDNVRRGYRHLSKAMVAEGYLPDSDLLYFLNISEISELLETRNPGLISRANHRRKLFPTLNSYIFPEIWRGRPIPVNESQDQVDYIADLTMKGIPVSQGCVKGYARIALTMEEASHLKPGEILITHCTDIGWSPYFPITAGVVTELGGLISHGAVVSREYGLPCVVGLHGATKMFRTGDYVLVDGNKGILQRLTPPE